jgi:hypothetical protein
MSMPEAAVNEDYSPMLREHKVRFARQALVMKEIAKASRMQALPNNQFGLRILAPDACHHPASYLSRNDVSHRRISVHLQQTEGTVAWPLFLWVAT